jgi:hypothetical protein
MCYIEKNSRAFRQSIVTTEVINSEMFVVFDDSRFKPKTTLQTSGEADDKNRNGLVKISSEIHETQVQLVTKELKIPKQMFINADLNKKFDKNYPDALFRVFTQKLWPEISNKKDNMFNTIVIIFSSFFDHLRVQKYFRNLEDDLNSSFLNDVCFCSLHENQKNKAQVENKIKFLKSDKGKPIRLLLISERLLWYKRTNIHFAPDTSFTTVLFYGSPETGDMYFDFLRKLKFKSLTTSMVLYTKSDAYSLERLVGSAGLPRLFQENSSNDGNVKVSVFS